MTKVKTILGIDPGTNILGFGVIRMDESGKATFVDMGIVDLRKVDDIYEKLHIIFSRITELCDRHSPECMAIESPFYGKNAQVILKLGRAQGAAITAAKSKGLEVYEYAPRKAKIAICGNGAASKEQVALMVSKTLNVELSESFLDATDALAIAMCHFYQSESALNEHKSGNSWEKFLESNPDRIIK